jgi:hypothetical protein
MTSRIARGSDSDAVFDLDLALDFEPALDPDFKPDFDPDFDFGPATGLPFLQW